MTEYKLVREQEWSQAVSLADRVFRDDEQKSMAEGFPLVFSPALRQSYGAFEEGRLVAFIGLVPHLIRIGTAILKTFSIGAVCTDPDERGRGHAGRILELVQQHAADAGASLLLVSGARPLYTRAHCYPYGEMHRYGLTPDGVGTVRKLREGITVRGMDPRICMPFTIWPVRAGSPSSRVLTSSLSCCARKLTPAVRSWRTAHCLPRRTASCLLSL